MDRRATLTGCRSQHSLEAKQGTTTSTLSQDRYILIRTITSTLSQDRYILIRTITSTLSQDRYADYYVCVLKKIMDLLPIVTSAAGMSDNTATDERRFPGTVEQT